jgi:U3 small nucleolar RNA-associated protein 3
LLDGDNLIDDDDGDEDEVFALKGLEDESDEDEDVDMDGVDDEQTMEETPASKKNKKQKKTRKSSHSSESEEEEEEEEETWGKSKSAYYSSNAPQLDSDDEEANELEEQEAKRLQAKAREDLEDADFGLEDAYDITTHQGTEYAIMSFLFRLISYLCYSELPEHAPAVVVPPPQDTNSLIRHLEKTSPETLALTRDWEDTAHSFMDTQAEIAK